MSPRPTRAPPYHCMSPSAATGHALNNTPGRWWIFFRGGQCIHHFHRYMATRGWEIGIGAETSLGSYFTGITSWMSSSATDCLMNWRRAGAFWGRGTWVERNFILIICIWSSSRLVLCESLHSNLQLQQERSWALDVSLVHEVKNTLEISELHTLQVR